MTEIELVSNALAASDAETQAHFLNSFYRHLRVCCKGREDNQLCYIAEHLDENGRLLLKDLGQYADLAVETRAKTETAVSDLYRQRHELEKELAELVETKKAIELSIPQPSA